MERRPPYPSPGADARLTGSGHLLLFNTKRDGEGEERDASDVATIFTVVRPAARGCCFHDAIRRLVVLPFNQVIARERSRPWWPESGAMTGAAPLPQAEANRRSEQRRPAVTGHRD
uniref:Uncharacterized protein n=1 Tax=Oryza meridionalis TaxID=40149 RepID=A0A0E0FDX4_9ORYZ